MSPGNPAPPTAAALPLPSGPFFSFDSGPFQARIDRNSGHVSIAGPDLVGAPHANVLDFLPGATIGGQTFHVGGALSAAPLPDGLEVVQPLGTGQVTARVTFPHEGVMRYEVVDWHGLARTETLINVASNGDEHFFGFGEKFNAFDQSGHPVHILTVDHPGTKGDNSYKVAPWFVSTRGYGFHLDSSAESHFDLRVAMPDRYVVRNSFPELMFNVVYGPKLTDVLTRYTGYTGRPPLPPPWAFGPWISSDIWRDGGEIRYAVSKFRERKIPASAFVFDSPWEVAYNDFTFNMQQFGRGGRFEGVDYPGFASVAELMSFLQTHGLKVICWMTPFVNLSSQPDEIEPSQNPKKFVPGQNTGKARLYDDGASKGVFVRQSVGGAPLVREWWKGQGSPIDFTRPEARVWLTEQLRTLLTRSEVGTRSGAREPAIGGFKTDDGESGNSKGSQYIPTDAVYADGRTGVLTRNAYCVEYHRTVYQVLGQSGLLFARSGFTGSHAFPGYWAGDNEPNFGENGLPGVIIAGQSAAMSGYSIWGHDVGGYQDTNFSVSPPNLFMRWTQFGCFSPIMQMHRQVKQSRQYPWSYDQEALANYQFFAQLHTQLFPYLYTYAREASTSGLPILRPLVLLHQEDANTFEIRDTYFFGNELLVAPMVTPNANSRRVYLPAGSWRDFWTNALHAGGNTIDWTDSNQAQMPLFVREGAIVPMLLGEVESLCDANYVNNAAVKTMSDGLQFLIYPSGASRFVVYDGTEIRCQANGGARTVTLTSAPRAVALKAFGAAPAAVAVNGASLTELASEAAFGAAPSGWWHDAAAGFVHIKFQHPGGTAQIKF